MITGFKLERSKVAQLHHAAESGDLEQVKALILVDKVDPNCLNKLGGVTPIFGAASQEHDAVLTFLLKHQADQILPLKMGSHHYILHLLFLKLEFYLRMGPSWVLKLRQLGMNIPL